ncbi:MAG: TIGR01777 family oxidoreductase [Chthoniobacterales bacterium]
MKTLKLILPGGNGYIGRLVSRHFASLGHAVVVLSRKPAADASHIRQVLWDGATPGAWMAELENADAVINLAGRSVNCRYTARHRQEIYDSRLRSTAVLGQAIAACAQPPKVWLNSSSATIYRHAEDREMDEATGEIGSGFSVDVCQKWEAALNEAATPNTRKVALRSAMVMGPGGDGVFQAFHRLSLWHLGGKLGNGRQFVSWVHWQDFLRALEWILENDHLSGAINIASPNPLPNRDFMRILREADRQSIGLPTPAWMLAIGAIFLRAETELVLKSRRVIPARLLADGFIFHHPHWETAVRNLLGHPIHPLLDDHFEPLHAPLHLGKR